MTDQEIDAAVDTVLAELATESYPLAKGWTLDLVETLRTNARAAEALTTDKPAWKRNMVPDRDPAGPSGEGMSPEEDPVAEAVTVLISRGHTVEPDDDVENWARRRR